ncbi:hypothetical protein K469DRAFT_755980 [Zopfia rhizophila CBS 207.26]|uniref:Uncharacterized protein n=1 Tax=Zopfia rhizophila CBS 207.26 TaxID=1314779 RepID=A0A6A6DD15_9PEZI|nr:hypothetical protein K469DRAFT_755980 [Zopfia rhizophila CBS 207.26]
MVDSASARSLGNGNKRALSKTPGRDNDTATADPRSSAIVQAPLYGKFTLTIDCDGLLKPDVNRPGIFTSRSADEAVQYYQLSTLLMVPILGQIKIKCFHTCGPVEFDANACLTTLWSVGDWFVEQYRAIGKSVQYENSTDGRGEDWAEPDATLIVFIN